MLDPNRVSFLPRTFRLSKLEPTYLISLYLGLLTQAMRWPRTGGWICDRCGILSARSARVAQQELCILWEPNARSRNSIQVILFSMIDLLYIMCSLFNRDWFWFWLTWCKLDIRNKEGLITVRNKAYWISDNKRQRTCILY